MKKQLLASLFSFLLIAGLAPMSMSATNSNSTSCCSGSNDCAIDKSPNALSKVLTKEECHRFCKAKAAAIAKDPSLAQPENKCKLCRAMVKADPSMRPICMKVRKYCRKMKKNHMGACHENTCTPSSAPSSSPSGSSSTPSQNTPTQPSTEVSSPVGSSSTETQAPSTTSSSSTQPENSNTTPSH